MGKNEGGICGSIQLLVLFYEYIVEKVIEVIWIPEVCITHK